MRFMPARTAVCTAADIEYDLPAPRPPRNIAIRWPPPRTAASTSFRRGVARSSRCRLGARCPNLCPATLGHHERRVDEAFFFIQSPTAQPGTTCQIEFRLIQIEQSAVLQNGALCRAAT